jgi:hypothetical protein
MSATPQPPAASSPALSEIEAESGSAPATGRVRLRRMLALLAVYIPFYLVYFTLAQAPFSLPHATDACGGRPILDTRWTYTARIAHDYLTVCGSHGRAALAHQQLADLVYPALYAAALSAAFSYLLFCGRLTNRRWRYVLFLPPLVAALDYTENIGIWDLLTSYPAPGRLAAHLSLVTDAKLALGYASIAVLASLIVAALAVRLRPLRHHGQHPRSMP